MILKDISLDTPKENILYDDVLFHLAEETHQEFLRFWESKDYFIVLGRACDEQEDLNIDQIKKDRISVLRRSSGGGTVVQGKGCLNYSLVLSKEKTPEIADLRKSYEFILGKVVRALKSLGKDCQFLPISDIALIDGQKKISGNAQKRGRKCILHHGTLLYNFDLNMIEKYLQMPKDIPEYRKERKHLDFVANLDLTSHQIKQEMLNQFSVQDMNASIMPHEERQLSDYLMNRSVEVMIDGF